MKSKGTKRIEYRYISFKELKNIAGKGQIMDQIDAQILGCLRDNARQTSTEISKKINMSVASVTERIHKLEKSGIIKQYTVLLDTHKIGNDVMAIMEVSLEHPKFYDNFTDIVEKTDEIISCNYITGDNDFMLQVSVQSSEKLEEFHRMIKSIKGVSNTKTSFVLKEVKNKVAAIPPNSLM